MKLLSLISTLALAISLSHAAAIPGNVEDRAVARGTPASIDGDDDFEFTKKSNIALEGEDAALEERGSDTRVDTSVSVRTGTPSSDFRPDGSGRGYSVDFHGNSAPSWVPSGWRWYGSGYGWCPPPSWRPPPHWNPPTVFVRVWVKVTWWSPPSYWRDYYSSRWPSSWYQYGVPSHWGWRPHGRGGGGNWQHRGGGYYWGGGHKRDGGKKEE